MKLYSALFVAFSVLSGTVSAQTTNDSTVVIVGGQEAALAYNQGITEFNGGDYNAAMKSFSNAISINGKFYQSYYNKGITELKKNLDKEALKDFTDAIALSGKKAVQSLTHGSEIIKRLYGRFRRLKA